MGFVCSLLAQYTNALALTALRNGRRLNIELILVLIIFLSAALSVYSRGVRCSLCPLRGVAVHRDGAGQRPGTVFVASTTWSVNFGLHLSSNSIVMVSPRVSVAKSDVGWICTWLPTQTIVLVVSSKVASWVGTYENAVVSHSLFTGPRKKPLIASAPFKFKVEKIPDVPVTIASCAKYLSKTFPRSSISPHSSAMAKPNSFRSCVAMAVAWTALAPTHPSPFLLVLLLLLPLLRCLRVFLLPLSAATSEKQKNRMTPDEIFMTEAKRIGMGKNMRRVFPGKMAFPREMQFFLPKFCLQLIFTPILIIICTYRGNIVDFCCVFRSLAGALIKKREEKPAGVGVQNFSSSLVSNELFVLRIYFYDQVDLLALKFHVYYVRNDIRNDGRSLCRDIRVHMWRLILAKC